MAKENKVDEKLMKQGRIVRDGPMLGGSYRDGVLVGAKTPSPVVKDATDITSDKK